MTDHDIKKMLQNAYSLPETEKGRRFVRMHEKRSLQLTEIIKIELRYMGLSSMAAGIALCVLFWLLARSGNHDVVWIISSLLPACALFPMVFLSRSERFGMEELEAASRFSLRFIKMVRMMILGLFTLGLLLIIGIAFRQILAVPGIDFILFSVTPYLISVWGSMILMRRWHGKEHIPGVIAVCLSGSVLPTVIKQLRVLSELPGEACLILLLVLLTAVTRETVLYIKESEKQSWNWC